MSAKPTIEIKAAPVSRCVAVQETVEALRVLLQIAARLDGAEEKPRTRGNQSG